mmetsp:Transcript_14694/g.49411  ORF Transcript_14694/g.49411 Transcript_14694/m.49411 type:complete len:281 (+) Transcript_14694:212-1054(+)
MSSIAVAALSSSRTPTCCSATMRRMAGRAAARAAVVQTRQAPPRGKRAPTAAYFQSRAARLASTGVTGRQHWSTWPSERRGGWSRRLTLCCISGACRAMTCRTSRWPCRICASSATSCTRCTRAALSRARSSATTTSLRTTRSASSRTSRSGHRRVSFGRSATWTRRRRRASPPAGSTRSSSCLPPPRGQACASSPSTRTSTPLLGRACRGTLPGAPSRTPTRAASLPGSSSSSPLSRRRASARTSRATSRRLSTRSAESRCGTRSTRTASLRLCGGRSA